MSKKKKPIDRVTTKRLDVALRMCGMKLPYEMIDKIIDLVELIEDKGGNTSMKDVCKLEAAWENMLIHKRY